MVKSLRTTGLAALMLDSQLKCTGFEPEKFAPERRASQISVCLVVKRNAHIKHKFALQHTVFVFFYRTSRSFWRVGLSFFKRPLLSSSGLRATTRPSSAERTPPWTKRTPGFAPCPLPRGEPPSERCRESTTCSPAFRSLVRGGNKLKKNNYNRMFSLASCRFINVLGKCLTQRRTQTSP